MADIILNPVLVAKIQNYMNDPLYRESVESAASFNSRLSHERIQRLPFLDSQTGVAQSHSNLWMEPRQRLPGLREGQIYTYPSKRWKKKRRQYLMNDFMQPRHVPAAKVAEENIESIPITAETNGHGHVHNTHGVPVPTTTASSSIVNPGPSVINEDSKDSFTKVDDNSNSKQDWFYDDIDPGDFEEPDNNDSDFDYEDSSTKRKNKKKGTPKQTRSTRGRRKITYDPQGDSEKPFACDLCSARYKTRPGLSYHFAHSHKDKEDEEEEQMHMMDQMVSASPNPKRDRDDGTAPKRGGSRQSSSSVAPPLLHPQTQAVQPAILPPVHGPHGVQAPHLIPQTNSPSVTAAGENTASPAAEVPSDTNRAGEKPQVQPSTYCDFCLGDATDNKKTGQAEELISCSTCGRSGHPTCLQFTTNMQISVKKYRWQCIECKSCTLCGTSDNDDQLLFCDDCDRGYHMYCLVPPLAIPPEGSWSCSLCLAEFHNNKKPT